MLPAPYVFKASPKEKMSAFPKRYVHLHLHFQYAWRPTNRTLLSYTLDFQKSSVYVYLAGGYTKVYCYYYTSTTSRLPGYEYCTSTVR
jgi:hypothetical protein